ncbi:hypothetical protein MML48_5g00019877 [Holotrichia oblita]|uniref:Uncharacterized protein n=1 Tax=Holotrichia oblita TaxID=644536 RepID=A0ACB9T5F3_HOLOL|nr:hypothetical protein MML48_5g00019877 [Holotrichia oblita]
MKLLQSRKKIEDKIQAWAAILERAISRPYVGQDRALTPANIKSGFQATGIYPFNQDAIPVEAFAPSTVTDNKTVTKDVEQIQPAENLPETIQPSKASSRQPDTSKNYPD